jgi:carboxymethylenebutenolidase
MATERSGEAFGIPSAGGALTGYLALPAAARGRGVLVLHEAWGLVDAMRDVCDRLAREGFVALAPDLYRGETAEALEDAARLMGALDVEAAVTALLGHHAVDGPKLGALGFCLGGHLALLAGERCPRVGAVVDFYGFHPGLPVDLAKISAPVLAIHAEADEYVPDERVKELRQALAGGRGSVHVQPGVGHGFMNPARPERHDAAAAAEGWDRLLAFLRAELP